MIDVLASIGSSACSTAAVYPLERIKLEIQFEKTQALSFKKAVATVLRTRGLKGFYEGLNSMLVGNMMSYAFYFGFYGKFTRLLEPINAGEATKTALASALAGIACSILTNPFWTLQSRQVKNGTTVVQELRAIHQSGTWMSLVKGLGASLVLVSNPVIQFVIYQNLKKRINVNQQGLKDLLIFLAGALSKAIATLLTYPYTVIRARQHVSSDQHGVWNSAMTILREESIRGLFKGLETKLLQTVLNSAILLMLFERFKALLLKRKQ